MKIRQLKTPWGKTNWPNYAQFGKDNLKDELESIRLKICGNYPPQGVNSPTPKIFDYRGVPLIHLCKARKAKRAYKREKMLAKPITHVIP